MAGATTGEHLRECLSDVRFPADKKYLLDAAVRYGDPTAVQALREMPPGEYRDLGAVLSAVR